LKSRSSPIFLTTAAFFWAAFCCLGQNYSISTIAGQGLALGDGGRPLAARFGSVSAVALGPDGSLYIADSAYHQVRKVTPQGNISLFAGGSVRGFGGDGGPATSALLDTPTALAVDSGGSVYIGESGNHRVRVVNIWGNIQTFAGNGQIAPAPNVSPVFPGEGGLATAAPLNQISGLAFASNSDLIISDVGNNRIFRVSSGMITTMAGNATTPASLAAQSAKSATLGQPTGVATDLYGNVYFSELSTDVVRMIDVHGNLTVLIGTGPGGQPIASGSPLSYPLIQPIGMASDSSFNMYIMETGRISMYTPFSPASGAAPMVQVIAGDITQKVTSGTGDGGPPLSAGMNPRSVAVDSQGNIYLADSLLTLNFNNRVRIIPSSYSNSTIITTFAGGNVPTGAGDKGPATSAQLYFPQAVAIGSQGTVYIADTSDNRVRAVTPDGNINTVAGTGTAGTTGNQGPATAANINQPAGLALDSIGNLYFTDGALIRQVGTTGIINLFAGGGSSTQAAVPAQTVLLAQTGSLAVDAQNDVYVEQLARVSEISAATQLISTVAGNGLPGYSGDNGPATAAQINGVAGVAVDSSGNLYIADGANNRIRKVDSTGNITTIAGGGASTADGVMATAALLNAPSAVAVDSAGNLYIAETGGDRMRFIGSDGTIHTIAGNGLQGFAGDGSIATNASLNTPADVKVDAQGNVYIADSLNSSIRKLTPLASLPTPSITSISNAGSILSGPVTPGERVVIAGTALGLNGGVMFDQHPAPVLISSITSLTVQVPYEVSAQTTSQVTVTVGGVTSAPFAVQIAPSAPGIYTLTGDGLGQAIAMDSDGFLNGNDIAQAGSTVAVLCTGEGVVSPAAMTGVPIGSSPPSPLLPVSATIDGESAAIDGAYSLPGAIGQFLVNVEVPNDISTNSNATLVITVGNASSQSTASISVMSAPDDSGDGSDLRVKKPGSKPVPR
jgi:uncharacterized protein (TIGR03437 family)